MASACGNCKLSAKVQHNLMPVIAVLEHVDALTNAIDVAVSTLLLETSFCA